MEPYSEICRIPGCGLTFVNMEGLKEHIETVHGDVKNLQCRECGKTLSSKQNLREHIFTHTGDKPYHCREPGCNLSFRQGSQLSAHKRIHVALHRAARQEDFVPLRLTDLLSKCPLPEDRPTVEILQETIDLPPISGSKSYSTLPRLQFDDSV